MEKEGSGRGRTEGRRLVELCDLLREGEACVRGRSKGNMSGEESGKARTEMGHVGERRAARSENALGSKKKAGVGLGSGGCGREMI